MSRNHLPVQYWLDLIALGTHCAVKWQNDPSEAIILAVRFSIAVIPGIRLIFRKSRSFIIDKLQAVNNQNRIEGKNQLPN